MLIHLHFFIYNILIYKNTSYKSQNNNKLSSTKNSNSRLNDILSICSCNNCVTSRMLLIKLSTEYLSSIYICVHLLFVYMCTYIYSMLFTCFMYFVMCKNIIYKDILQYYIRMELS